MIYKEANTLVAANFTDSYFHLHDYLYTQGDTVASRNGTTKEILNFKTTLTNPLNRCVAGYRRNINIFFLLAEAMWIFKGRRDLEFLEIFNSGMKAFSDNGKYFHSPYGFRIRRQGLDAMQELSESNEQGRDQLAVALDMLYNNPEDRRVVISIWNHELDLNVKSLDIACNTMLMFKIRNQQLHQTIQNRSNDLNLGLPTNVFQFSFIGEVMAALLGVQYATQTHNSQSLHLYMQHELTTHLQSEFLHGDYALFQQQKLNFCDFYSLCDTMKIEFKFMEENMPVRKKLFWVDFYLHGIIMKLLTRARDVSSIGKQEEVEFESSLKEFSFYFWFMYRLLCVYVDYKNHKSHHVAVEALHDLYLSTGTSMLDISLMSMNFFLRRILDKSRDEYTSVLGGLVYVFPRYKGLQLGKY